LLWREQLVDRVLARQHLLDLAVGGVRLQRACADDAAGCDVDLDLEAA